ncbi:MAG: SpoIID/LytB domain-containing protein [Deltaproteobacteria bacterium]|nr:SpoIID/LytB domain-containing protein [Deltaproteobacteria bacterium]
MSSAAAVVALACAFAAAPWEQAEPSPVPSGMDLLYSDRVAFKPKGEPLITLGIATGRERVALRSATAIQADFYEAGTLKRATVRGGDTIEVSIHRAQMATRRTYVDIEGVPWGAADRLDWTLAGWRARGYPEVETIEEGAVLGIGGRVIDNRELRVVLPVVTRKEATAKIDEIYARFGVRAVVSSRLAERPWGELKVRATSAPLGTATSYVRLVAPGGAIQVDGVEHSRGYAWHGFEDRQFKGEIYVVVDPDGRLAVVNVLGAEDVIAGVVPAEIFASAPPEALKAQAVAARNQLFAKLGKRHHDDPFHLCSEQHCQVYAGVTKEDARATAAVTATSGELVFLHDALVDTVYSSSCGGHTEDNDAVWGNRPDPALRGRPDFDVEAEPGLETFAHGITAANLDTWLRTRPASFCGKASKANPDKLRWRKIVSAAELATLLADLSVKLGALTHLEVVDRGPGGRVKSLRLIGDKGEVTVLHELNIRRLFGNLNSGVFRVDEERDRANKLAAVTFVGGGWGHGVGMCQVGAVGRAEAGHAYRQILGYYYNGAVVARLYDTTRAALEPAPR